MNTTFNFHKNANIILPRVVSNSSLLTTHCQNILLITLCYNANSIFYEHITKYIFLTTFYLKVYFKQHLLPAYCHQPPCQPIATSILLPAYCYQPIATSILLPPYYYHHHIATSILLPAKCYLKVLPEKCY